MARHSARPAQPERINPSTSAPDQRPDQPPPTSGRRRDQHSAASARRRDQHSAVPPASGRRRDLRTAAQEVARHWDTLQERVPAPVLRVLVTLPWVLRRMPVPFWVPLVLMLLRRIRKRRARRAARAATHPGVPPNDRATPR